MPTTARRPASIWTPNGTLLGFAARELPAYFLRQRWYPAKNAGLPTVRLAALIPLDVPEMPTAIALWTAEPPGQPTLCLFLPLGVFRNGDLQDSHPAVIGRLPGEGGVLADACAADCFVRALVRLMIDPDVTVPELRSGRTARLDSAGFNPRAEWAVRRGAAEQSNTSLRIGDGAILKVIRKLERGVHPELEMARFLTETVHFARTPPLLGWMDLDGTTLAILQTFVSNQGDGWNWILERLRADCADQYAMGIAWVRHLGGITAELHAALATRSGDPAFDPEPVVPEDWDRWMSAVEKMAERVAEMLALGRPGADPGWRSEGRTEGGALPLRDCAEAFATHCRRLRSTLEHLMPRHATAAKTRHHGDYHLGQVLVCGASAMIIDFEGEPMRPLAERRAKHVPLRDVAGLLRSLAYAGAVTERALPDTLSARQREARAARLHLWVQEASEAFLDGYFAVPGSGGVPSTLQQADARRLIEFFYIEKALYEAAYELANRPDWAAIPLAAINSLLEASGARAALGAVRRVHRMPYGAELDPGGGVRFRLWAPACPRIHLALHGTEGAAARLLPMAPAGNGWHEAQVADASAGTRYQFVLPDGMHVPDPASRFQPEDVHGPSEVIDAAAFVWTDAAWRGRPWHEAVIYEMHVGAFTPAGTFRAAIERLDHLEALGVTAIEIMPIADFPGRRNWGYDGVLPYAPDSTYGRPEDLKALVDAAHARGLLVLLDVVYNHFGPDGNYLPVYAPAIFTERHQTPWGAALNFDGPHSGPVREFVIHNALYWLEEYHLDGLRLDAVHAIRDDGSSHLLDELARRARALGGNPHLVLENEENQARWLERAADAAPRLYTAQWNDDVHHVLHVAATSEDHGYYHEYKGDVGKLGRALAEGFAFQGQVMAFRGSPRGEPSGRLPPTAFVAFIQNHDQIGNRAFGDRITAIAPLPAVRAIAAVYLLLPQVPMLFMGEEWATKRPFPFFCDFTGELADAVRAGRRAEFARFPEFRDAGARERIPDPQAESTFASAKLDWSELDEHDHAEWYGFYRRLLALRREVVVPLLPRMPSQAGHYRALGPDAVRVRWQVGGHAGLNLDANLSGNPSIQFPAAEGRILWQEGAVAVDGTADPWAVRWCLAAAEDPQ